MYNHRHFKIDDNTKATLTSTVGNVSLTATEITNDQGLDDLIGQYQDISPILDVESVPNYKQLIHNISTYKPYQPNSEIHSVRYTGQHFRNCNERSQCNGIRGQYYPDIIKTNNSLSIPILGNQSSELEIVSQKEQIDVAGFYNFFFVDV